MTDVKHEIPEDLKQPYKNICGLIKEGITLAWFGNTTQKELIERIAQLTAEREEDVKATAEIQEIAETSLQATLNAAHARIAYLEKQVERLSANVSDEEEEMWAQELTEDQDWAFSKGSIYNMLANRSKPPEEKP